MRSLAVAVWLCSLHLVNTKLSIPEKQQQRKAIKVLGEANYMKAQEPVYDDIVKEPSTAMTTTRKVSRESTTTKKHRKVSSESPAADDGILTTLAIGSWTLTDNNATQHKATTMSSDSPTLTSDYSDGTTVFAHFNPDMFTTSQNSGVKGNNIREMRNDADLEGPLPPSTTKPKSLKDSKTHKSDKKLKGKKGDKEEDHHRIVKPPAHSPQQPAFPPGYIKGLKRASTKGSFLTKRLMEPRPSVIKEELLPTPGQLPDEMVDAAKDDHSREQEEDERGDGNNLTRTSMLPLSTAKKIGDFYMTKSSNKAKVIKPIKHQKTKKVSSTTRTTESIPTSSSASSSASNEEYKRGSDQFVSMNIVVSDPLDTTGTLELMNQMDEKKNTIEMERVTEEEVKSKVTEEAATNGHTDMHTASPLIKQQWRPYHMDCKREVDEKGEALCQEWAAAGLCLEHNPTKFLFCRKRCLCLGPN